MEEEVIQGGAREGASEGERGVLGSLPLPSPPHPPRHQHQHQKASGTRWFHVPSACIFPVRIHVGVRRRTICICASHQP